jgi:excisionase family DNA binding protein
MTDDRTDERSGSPWMKPEAAAEYLGIALGTLRNWTSAKYVPHAKRGRVVRYHREHMDKWLLKGACPGRATLPDLAATRPAHAGS